MPNIAYTPSKAAGQGDWINAHKQTNKGGAGWISTGPKARKLANLLVNNFLNLKGAWHKIEQKAEKEGAHTHTHVRSAFEFQLSLLQVIKRYLTLSTRPLHVASVLAILCCLPASWPACLPVCLLARFKRRRHFH